MNCFIYPYRSNCGAQWAVYFEASAIMGVNKPLYYNNKMQPSQFIVYFDNEEAVSPATHEAINQE